MEGIFISFNSYVYLRDDWPVMTFDLVCHVKEGGGGGGGGVKHIFMSKLTFCFIYFILFFGFKFIEKSLSTSGWHRQVHERALNI